MDITLTIKAEPKLLKVLERFANTIESNNKIVNLLPDKNTGVQTKPVAPIQQLVTPQVKPVVPQPIPQNVPQQPVQQSAFTPQPIAQPVQPMQPTVQVPQPVPTAVQSYTMDQLAKAGTQLIDAGKLQQLQQLLASFGVQALTMLPKEQYGAFATKLRELGAKI